MPRRASSGSPGGSGQGPRTPLARGSLTWHVVLLLGVLAATGAGEDTSDAPSQIKVPDLRTRTDGIDWEQFLGPTGNNRSPETGIRTEWSATGPPLVWKKKLGGGYSAPAVSRGRLFLFDRIKNKARLRCLNSETGEHIWTFTYPCDYRDRFGYDGGPRCAPVVDGGRVYIYGPEGMLHALRVTDGKLLWKVDTFERFNVVPHFFGVGAAPVVHGDHLVAQVGGSPPNSPSVFTGRVEPNGTAVVAFDKFTGEVAYAAGDELASYARPVFANLHGRPWGFVFARGGLLAFDPASGATRFHFPWRADKTRRVNAATPVVVDDKVFVSETYGPGGALIRVKRGGGYEVVWSDKDKIDKSMQAHWNTPVYHEGYLYGSSGRHMRNAELRCIDFETGEVQWSKPGLGRCNLLYVDGHFVCLSERGNLLLLKATPKKYKVVTRGTPTTDGEPPSTGRNPRNTNHLIKHPAWAPPVLSHGLLYIRGDGRLACLELIPPPEQ